MNIYQIDLKFSKDRSKLFIFSLLGQGPAHRQTNKAIKIDEIKLN